MANNGIIKYYIEPDGCLIGTHTNIDGIKGCEFYPEWAKKNLTDSIKYFEENKEIENLNGFCTIDSLEGIYDCVYPGNDHPKDPTICKLKIERDTNPLVFHFLWYDRNNPTVLSPFHKGLGRISDDNIINVSYWEV